jgi:hypothetical protein
MNARSCGDCTLCCTLIPVSEINKAAGKQCWFLRKRKGGCLVYRGPMFPRSCKLWSCGWLLNMDAEHLARPDNAHYVIDPSPDYIVVSAADGTHGRLPVVQIWIDPKFPDAHRNPNLRAWINRRAKTHGQAALIRFNSSDAIVLLPPDITGAGWILKHPQRDSLQHSAAEINRTYAALSRMKDKPS